MDPDPRQDPTLIVRLDPIPDPDLLYMWHDVRIYKLFEQGKTSNRVKILVIAAFIVFTPIILFSTAISTFTASVNHIPYP